MFRNVRKKFNFTSLRPLLIIIGTLSTIVFFVFTYLLLFSNSSFNLIFAQLNKGDKVCSFVEGGNWRDTINVLLSWKTEDCLALGTIIGVTQMQIGCVNEVGFVSFSSSYQNLYNPDRGKELPDPNCGWEKTSVSWKDVGQNDTQGDFNESCDDWLKRIGKSGVSVSKPAVTKKNGSFVSFGSCLYLVVGGFEVKPSFFSAENSKPTARYNYGDFDHKTKTLR